MTKKTQAVAKVVEQEQLPDFMKEDVGHGMEDIGQEAVELPRLKLLQALSPELEDHDELRPGEFFHNIVEVSVGKEVEFVPCYATHGYILFAPREAGGGILARADDGKTWDVRDDFEVAMDGKMVVWSTKAGTVSGSRLDAWGSSDPENPKSAPAATAMINVVCFLPAFPDYSPVVLTFQRSSYKIGKRLISNTKLSNIPSFGRRFMASATKVDGPRGSYLEPRMKAIGTISDEETYNICRGIYQTFKRMGAVRAKVEPDTEETQVEEENY